MTTRTGFQPQILLNRASVNSFLNGESEAAQIVRYRPIALKPEQYETFNYFYSSIVLPLAHYLLRLLCFKDLSKKIWVMSRHAIDNETALKTGKVFGQNLLGRAINTHRKDTADYYLQPSRHIPFLTYPNKDNLDFFQKEGVCKGMCYWFAFLYFKTKDKFTDPVQHIQAVTAQFSKGAPRQAAFLHGLQNKPIYNLLKLDVQEACAKVNPANKTREQICRAFQSRPPGVYGIHTTTPHFVLYVKVDDAHQYLFDPMKGSINVASGALFKKAMDSYFDTHDNTKEIEIDCLSPRSPRGSTPESADGPVSSPLPDPSSPLVQG
jgi:hypothetical protein